MASYTDADLEEWLRDATTAGAEFPFENVENREVFSPSGKGRLLKEIYESAPDKTTMLMFGRNLL
jgi:hypothetical protein